MERKKHGVYGEMLFGEVERAISRWEITIHDGEILVCATTEDGEIKLSLHIPHESRSPADVAYGRY
jgi:hypothetical protein